MIIKEKPEDFIVIEKNKLNNIDNKGKYYIYELSKKNLGTQEAVNILKQKFGRKFNYCGNKDKIAVTKQLISSTKKIPDFVLEKENFYLKIKFCGINSEPLSLGSHEGNYFEIRLTNILNEDMKKPFSMENFSFPNYFGEQRFSKNNVKIGNLILERNFREALNLIDDIWANKHLENKPNDLLGALKKIPRKTLRLFLSAVQSEEFNLELSKKISGKELIFSEQKLVFGDYSSKEKLLMKGWDSGKRKFLFKEYPEISLEGVERETSCEAKNIEFDGDTIKFYLPKGSYATIFLRAMFLENIFYK